MVKGVGMECVVVTVWEGKRYCGVVVLLGWGVWNVECCSRVVREKRFVWKVIFL